MKKIVMIFAAMAAVLSSCTKNEMESVSANDCKDIVLNISVSNPGADDSKALVKTGWVKDDQIKIWFDDRTGDTPDLVIKYDGSDWEGTPASAPTKQSGSIKAVYNNFVIVASKDEYKYTDNTLSFNIKNWKFLTEIQVVVKGLDYDVNEPYTLSCDKFTPLNKTGFKVTADSIESVVKTKGSPAVGQANADGVAFVFATAEYSSADAKFKFTLKNLTNEDFGTKEYTATTDKIQGTTGSMTAIKALSIESSKFAVPAPEYVTIGGLNWATKNLGATTVNDFGLLYSWGNITGQTGSPFTTSQYKKTEGDKINNSTVLWDKEKHDAAYVATGGKWRMPTKEEFDALNTACKVNDYKYSFDISSEYIENGKVKKGRYWLAANQTVLSGINELKDITAQGILFSDGENYVFFPSAGSANYEGTSRIAMESGYYWSSTYYSSGKDQYEAGEAYRLNFSRTGFSVTSSNRSNGYSIRPVADVN